MPATKPAGWRRLTADPYWCRGEGRFTIRAYSEYLPPPWLGVKPYGDGAPPAHDRGDEYGWNVSEYEQLLELRPGLKVIARELLKELTKLGRGLPAPQIGRHQLDGNP